MVLAFIGIALAILFFVLYRSGFLEELPRILGRAPGDPPYEPDPEEERRLEVYKEFFEGDSEKD